jgi:hypothetical protein
MSISTEPAAGSEFSSFDLNNRVDEIFAEHGFADTNDEGDVVRVKTAVVKAIADVLITKGLAANPGERVEKAMTKEVLYADVFPHGPDLEVEDPLENAAANTVATFVWSMMTPSYNGPVQVELGNRSGSTDLMLCRRKIGRVASAYVTREDDLIFDDFVVPASEKVVKVADKTRRDMALAVQRRPTLEGRIRRELESMAAKTSIALGVSTSIGVLNPGE